MVSKALSALKRQSPNQPAVVLDERISLEDSIIVPLKIMEVLLKKAFKDYEEGEFETPEYRKRRIGMALSKANDHDDINAVLEDELVMSSLTDFIQKNGAL